MPRCQADVASLTRRTNKWARVQAPSEQWRQRLLKSCLQRFKTSRATSQDERRQARLRIIAEETHRHCVPTGNEQAELAALFDDLEDALSAEREADAGLQQLMEMLQREADEDVEELMDFHERAVRSRGRAEGMDELAEEMVLCPMCSQRDIHVEGGVVSCECGMKVECGTCDNITLPMVRERLGAVMGLHGATCVQRLQFSVQHTFGNFLWARCSACSFECVVL